MFFALRLLLFAFDVLRHFSKNSKFVLPANTALTFKLCSRHAQIFCNIESLYKLHDGFLKSLEELATQWPCVFEIGELFVEMAADFEAYAVYVSNFVDASMPTVCAFASSTSRSLALRSFTSNFCLLLFVSTLVGHLTRCQKSAAFFDALQACADAAENELPLPALLSMPLNRVGEYVILLETFAGLLERGRTLNVVTDALAIVKQTHRFIQDKSDNSQNLALVRAVRRRVPCKETLNLAIPTRVYVVCGKKAAF